MNLSKAQYIEELVFTLLEDILMMPRSKINVTDQIIKDLKMDSDDANFMFVPELERRLEIEVSEKEWSKDRTVQDVLTG
jgi:acyl carrier protein